MVILYNFTLGLQNLSRISNEIINANYISYTLIKWVSILYTTFPDLQMGGNNYLFDSFIPFYLFYQQTAGVSPIKYV